MNLDALRAEMDRMTTHSARGHAYTIGMLREAFDRHQQGHWKEAQCALVATYEEAVLAADAFEHFHGVEAEIRDLDGAYGVFSPGYGG
jgi:hypothetical protein